MKTKNGSMALKSIVYASLMFALILFTQSCSKKITFATSPVVPAAEGSVRVKTDNNNNYTIDLKITQLAEARRLSPSRQMYIVWIETEKNGIKNIGQLKSSSGVFSSSLKSSLKTVSSFKPKKIFITAEDDANMQYPNGQVVLSTKNF